MTAAFYTLGCKVNQYDTQTMMELFRQAGWEIVEFSQRADVYIVNTCTVTAMSDKKSRQVISRAHACNPDGIIVVAGCYAQRAAEDVLARPGVRLALGNKNRGNVVELVERIRQEDVSINAADDVMQAREFEELSALSEGRTRAHLKIQDGCNRFCSYCIIPYARGPVRSRELSEIVREVKRLAGEGFAEFVLTGIHLASYGLGTSDTLLDVLEAVSAVDGVQRVRLGSLEPAALTETFLKAAAKNKKLCRQFHISMQSGSETVLKRMNRRYTPEEFAATVEAVRRHMEDAAITTDVIAGFPGETDEEHRETLLFVERMRFARIHVFPFSRREGTKAAEMPNQLPKSTKDRRAHKLIELGKQLEHVYIDRFLGTRQRVLFEESDECGRMIGYTGTYISVAVEDGKAISNGEIADVELLRREGETAIGRII